MRTWTTAVAALLAVNAIDAAATENTLQARFHGTARIAADGTVQVTSLDGVDGSVADAVRAHVQALHALPAAPAGVAVDASAPLAGRVLLTPLDEGRFNVTVDQVALQPAVMKRSMISYPIEAMRRGESGVVTIEFALDARGAPTGLTVLSATDRVFADAATKASRHWRYASDAFDATRRLRMTFDFVTGWTSPAASSECPIDAKYPRLPGETMCIDRITVTGTRVP